MAKKTTTKALTIWDQRRAEAAAKQSTQNISTGGNIIGTAGGIMKYQGAEIPGNMVRGVILARIYANLWYEGDFEPGNADIPACYAYSEDRGEDMAPHPKAEKPQNETCAGCQLNEWGSAARGQGKACGNKVRLALISESDLEKIASAEIAFVHVPVTSVRAWIGYARNLNDAAHLPVWAVLTEIALEQDAQTQFKMTFTAGGELELDAKQQEALLAKVEQAEREINFEYVPQAKSDKTTRGRGRNRQPARRQAAPPPPPPRRPAPRKPAPTGKGPQLVRGKAGAAPARRPSKF